MGRLPRVVLAAGLAFLLAVVGLSRCTSIDHSDGDAQVMASGLEVPWGLSFLPTGDALVGERMTGDVHQIAADGGERELVGTVPDVEALGEGGLLGIAVDPLFIHDSFVYAYLTTAEDNRIVRFRLDPAEAEIYDLEVILDGIAAGSIHNGGALAFGPDGMLYAGVGDTGRSELAQDPDSLNGKILRMDPLGNPPIEDPNPDPESLVWSMGHRNVQGLAWDEQGRMYATEFGQNAFDEVNLIRPGANYGWPAVEGEGGAPQYVDPILTWTTDEASPSGAAMVGNTLYVAALRGQRMWRVDIVGDDVTAGSFLEGQYGRLRNVQVAPDGCLWVTTSNRDGRGEFDDDDDRVLRVSTGSGCELDRGS